MLLELYTSDLLFPVHHGDEHLALVQHICGTIPTKMVPQASTGPSPYFNEDLTLKNPNQFPPTKARHVRHKQTLKEIVRPRDAEFYDVVKQMLRVDPDERITAKAALKHPFFSDMKLSESTMASGQLAESRPSSASLSVAGSRPNSARPVISALLSRTSTAVSGTSKAVTPMPSQALSKPM